MPVVTNTVLDEADQPLGDALVRIVLGGGTGDGVGSVVSGDHIVTGRYETRTQGDGTWQITVPAASALITDPPGSFYQVNEFARGDQVSRIYHIFVPTGEGPFVVPEIIGSGSGVEVGGWLGGEQPLLAPDP